MYYDLEAFGKNICQLRKVLGYTQKDVATFSTLTIETLRKIENGKVLPTHITLELLSPILKEDLNQLLLNYRLSNQKELYEIKSRIEYKIENGIYVDLKKDLNDLNEILYNPNLSNYTYKLIQQLSLLVESIIIKTINSNYEASLIRLIDAMKVITPLFNLSRYTEFVYSNIEIRILMNIALLQNQFESIEKCQEMLLFCLDLLNPEEIDLKIRILYNLSYTFHRKDLHEKALYYANEGIKSCIENNTLSCLALLYSRKGIAEYFLKDDIYIASLKNAINIYDMTNQDNLKYMLMRFCKKHNIDIS